MYTSTFGQKPTDFQSFLKLRDEANNLVAFDVVFADMLTSTKTVKGKKRVVVDHLSALLLSQIVYWHMPDKSGVSRLRVTKRNKQGNEIWWLAKRREDWMAEVRMSPDQVDRSLKVLKKKGWIEVKIHRFSSFPTTHIRLLAVKFLADYQSAATRLFSDSSPISDLGLEPRTDFLPQPENINIDHQTETTSQRVLSKGVDRTPVDSSYLEDLDDYSMFDDPHEEEKEMPTTKLTANNFLSLGSQPVEEVAEEQTQEVTEPKLDRLSQIVLLFRELYYAHFGEEHPAIKNASAKRALESLASWDEEMKAELGMEISVLVYRAIMQKYFETNFKEGTNKRFEHFCNHDILTYRYREIFRPFGTLKDGNETPIEEIHRQIESEQLASISS